MSQELQSKLKSARAQLNLSQSKMAAAMGVPLKTYIKWEHGERTPRGLALEMLEQKLKALERGAKE